VSWRYLIDVLEILVGVQEILVRCHRDISSVSWKYLEGVLEILVRCHRHIWSVSWRYLVGVLVIFDRCPGDI